MALDEQTVYIETKWIKAVQAAIPSLPSGPGLLCTWNHAGSGNSEGLSEKLRRKLSQADFPCLLQSRIIPQQGFCILGVQGVAPRRCGHLVSKHQA